MANYHLTAQMLSRAGGKSCVAALAYRSATELLDQRTGEVWDYTHRLDVIHVEILIPDNAPAWISDIAQECKSDRQSAIQKFSDICEAAEKRNDSQVYREVEFSLPNELTDEQNIAWANEFVKNVFAKRGMVAVMNFHRDIDPKTGIEKPHCHVVLTTRHLTEEGLGLKNRDWNSKELLEEAREQCAQYQNAALKEHGFDVQVSHLSLVDQGLDFIDPQPKLGQNVREMTERGIETDKQKIFDMVRLKNQFKIVKNPEVVFSIVTSKHSTFTRKDIAKVLNRYIDDAEQFRILHDRLMNSKELVNLESSGVHKDIQEPVYTTQEMLRIEMNLVRQAEKLSVQHTHKVSPKIINKVFTKHNKKFKKHGGLSPDQEAAIRHMLASQKISCVVGFAGAGKTTCLEAVREAWEEEGYKIIGLAPTGKAARNIEGSGIRSMTIHKFLYAQKDGRERISDKTILVVDEFGMVDSRRCSELLSLIDKMGSKVVPMGDGNQAQSVEAGPAFRLLTDRAKPVVLEKVVRQQTEWQREATRLFGMLQTRAALNAYQEHGCFTTIQEKTPAFNNKNSLLDNFCLARQMSGRIWKEMMEDFKAEFGKDFSFDPELARQETDFEILAKHQDFKLFKDWKKTRQAMVGRIIDHYDSQKEELKKRGVNVKVLGSLVAEYKVAPVPSSALFNKIETILRQMSYEHIYDTRESTRGVLVEAWAKEYQASPDQSHLMLAFTNKDANKLNEIARTHMREQGKIQGKDYEFVTQRIETDDFDVEYKTYHDRTFAKGDRILFTRNNNSLEVKNGSLGTIHGISKSKITVALDGDGEDKQIVSFSPNLYPFIDNGWATTIIKAQGVTVDHVKLLASFEQYRNLAYVGMSRHRQTLQIFCSSFDFWREEKIIDRLSRIQEKLSGFDYLDAEKIQEKLEEDTKILWHHQKIQQGKDFWKAIKVTAQDVFDKALGRPQGEKGEEEFQPFEDSEEMRSRDFFEDSSNMRGKGAFTGGEDLGSDGGHEGTIHMHRPHGTASEVQGKGGPSHDPSLPMDQNPSSTQNPSHERFQDQQSYDQASSKDTAKSQPEKPEFMDQSPQSKDKEKSVTDPSSSKAQASTSQQENQENKPSVSSLDTDTFDEKLKVVQDKINSEYDSKLVFKEKDLSFTEVEEQLKERIFELATGVIDKPIILNTARELRFGKEREIRVVLSGKYQGFYHNFETGIKGGPLKLIEDQQGLSSRDALKWAADWLGGNQVVIERHAVVKKKDISEDKRSEWIPIFPVPKGQENPDIAGNKYLNVMLKGGWKEVARYDYRDEQGNLKGYVVRFEKPNEDEDKVDKKTPPLAYCENASGKRAWRWVGFEKENKTPYRIEMLAKDASKPILVVEGEKTADAAQKLLPEYHVITWGGGAGNVDKTNWEPLVGKTVVIWPDYDYDGTGQEAAKKLQKIVIQLNKEAGKEGCVGIVDLLQYLPNSEYLPNKWDLADKLPDIWTYQTVREFIKTAIDKALQETPNPSNAKMKDTSRGIENKIDAMFGNQQSQDHQAPQSKFDTLRNEFEDERWAFHQEWCATFGFMDQHRRFPESAEEFSAAYCQGELLTVIEGFFYQQALEKYHKDGKTSAIPKDAFIHQARQELLKHQKTPESIMNYGRASDLTGKQQQEFEQHVLIHSYRTGSLPTSTDLDAICRAIKDHSQIGDSGSGQVPEQSRGQVKDLDGKSSNYRHFIEQQAILAQIKNRQWDSLSNAIKMQDIQKACTEKLEHFTQKLKVEAQLSQEMTRSRQRGIDMGL